MTNKKALSEVVTRVTDAVTRVTRVTDAVRNFEAGQIETKSEWPGVSTASGLVEFLKTELDITFVIIELGRHLGRHQYDADLEQVAAVRAKVRALLEVIRRLVAHIDDASAAAEIHSRADTLESLLGP